MVWVAFLSGLLIGAALAVLTAGLYIMARERQDS